MDFGTQEYYVEKIKRLEAALKDACYHIHIIKGGLGDNCNYEYEYFLKKHGVNDISQSADNKKFEVGQIIATKIPVKDPLKLTTTDIYVGEIIRIEDKDRVIVSFDREAQKLAREREKVVLDTPLAVPILTEKIWGAEMSYTIDTWYEKNCAVKVVQFVSPNSALVRYPDGDIISVNVNGLKCAEK